MSAFFRITEPELILYPSQYLGQLTSEANLSKFAPSENCATVLMKEEHSDHNLGIQLCNPNIAQKRSFDYLAKPGFEAEQSTREMESHRMHARNHNFKWKIRRTLLQHVVYNIHSVTGNMEATGTFENRQETRC